MKKKFYHLIIVASVILSSACASSRMGDRLTDTLFRQQRYEEAAEHLKKGLEKETESGKDGLLYLMDLGLALHSAGKYEESNRYLLRADKLAEIKDYTSLAAESATLLTSDNIKQYKGEDFENVLINVYLSMNYACMGNTEDALIEARRVNRKLYLMTTEGKRKYKQNAFARYLSAILYESNGDWDHAYLDYKFTAELVPGLPGIGEDLWRMAFRQNMRDEMDDIAEKYKLTKAQKDEARRRVGKDRPGEIIVLFQNGLSPVKGPNPGFHSIPKFYPRLNPVHTARVSVATLAPPQKSAAKAGKKLAQGASVSESPAVAQTHVLENIEQTAISNLDEKWGGILAKKIAGVVAKEAIGNAVASSTDNAALGAILKFALHASDQADTRSWQLLPKDLQVARIPVGEGTHTITVSPVGAPPLPEKTVQVKRGQKVFVNFRYMP